MFLRAERYINAPTVSLILLVTHLLTTLEALCSTAQVANVKPKFSSQPCSVVAFWLDCTGPASVPGLANTSYSEKVHQLDTCERELLTNPSTEGGISRITGDAMTTAR